MAHICNARFQPHTEIVGLAVAMVPNRWSPETQQYDPSLGRSVVLHREVPSNAHRLEDCGTNCSHLRVHFQTATIIGMLHSKRARIIASEIRAARKTALTCGTGERKQCKIESSGIQCKIRRRSWSQILRSFQYLASLSPIWRFVPDGHGVPTPVSPRRPDQSNARLENLTSIVVQARLNILDGSGYQCHVISR